MHPHPTHFHARQGTSASTPAPARVQSFDPSAARRPWLALLLALAVLIPFVPAPADAATGTISGVAFHDANRDGKLSSGEERFAGHAVQLYDVDGKFVWQTQTDSDGWYSFTGLAPGTYTVRYGPATWWDIRESWVPTTTGSILPTRSVSTSTSDAHFGWRPLVRSTDLNAPISEFTGASGLRTFSYNDAVTAREIHDALMLGALVGEEAPHVSVRFGYSSSSSHSGVITQSGGLYTTYRGTLYVSYVSWLDGGDRTLFHEYGHAWSYYHAYITQQDPQLTGYLEARGLADDDRVGTSYAWDPWEIIAEDYRHLFGSDSARQGGQINRDILLASEVPGLEEYLRDVFTAAPASDPEPSTEPAPGAADDGAPPIELEVAVSKARGQYIVDLRWSGAQSTDVEVHQDGTLVARTANTGNYRYQAPDKSADSAIYQICEAGTSRCSAPTMAGGSDGGGGGGSGRGGPRNR